MVSTYNLRKENIRMREDESCVPVSYTCYRECLGPWLDAQGLEYKAYSGEEISPEMPHSYVLRGHEYHIGVTCIVSRMDPDDLKAVFESMIYASVRKQAWDQIREISGREDI